MKAERVVAHMNGGECYADEGYRTSDFGPALADVYEAAHALIGVTSHVNVSGPEYQDRKEAYATLRRTLDDPRLAPVRKSLGLTKVHG